MPNYVKIKNIDLIVKNFLNEHPDESIEKLSVEIGVHSRTIYRLIREGKTNNLKLIVGLRNKIGISYEVLLGDVPMNDFNFKDNEELISYLKRVESRLFELENKIDNQEVTQD